MASEKGSANSHSHSRSHFIRIWPYYPHQYPLSRKPQSCMHFFSFFFSKSLSPNQLNKTQLRSHLSPDSSTQVIVIKLKKEKEREREGERERVVGLTYTRCGLFVVVWHNYHQGSLLRLPKHLHVAVSDAARKRRLRWGRSGCRRCRRRDRGICEVGKDPIIIDEPFGFEWVSDALLYHTKYGNGILMK